MGFTLIELMVVIAIGAILLKLAAPAFSNMLAKKRVEGVASELGTDLQFARSEAVRQNSIVRIYFATSCYAIYIPGSTAATSCNSLGTGATALKTVQLDSGSTASFSFSPTTAGHTYIEFDPVRGMAVDSTGVDYSGYINVTSSTGSWQMRELVNKVGRVKNCSPNASINGMPNCT